MLFIYLINKILIISKQFKIFMMITDFRLVNNTKIRRRRIITLKESLVYLLTIIIFNNRNAI